MCLICVLCITRKCTVPSSIPRGACPDCRTLHTGNDSEQGWWWLLGRQTHNSVTPYLFFGLPWKGSKKYFAPRCSIGMMIPRPLGRLTSFFFLLAVAELLGSSADESRVGVLLIWVTIWPWMGMASPRDFLKRGATVSRFVWIVWLQTGQRSLCRQLCRIILRRCERPLVSFEPERI